MNATRYSSNAQIIFPQSSVSAVSRVNFFGKNTGKKIRVAIHTLSFASTCPNTPNQPKQSCVLRIGPRNNYRLTLQVINLVTLIALRVNGHALFSSILPRIFHILKLIVEREAGVELFVEFFQRS